MEGKRTEGSAPKAGEEIERNSFRSRGRTYSKRDDLRRTFSGCEVYHANNQMTRDCLRLFNLDSVQQIGQAALEFVNVGAKLAALGIDDMFHTVQVAILEICDI